MSEQSNPVNDRKILEAGDGVDHINIHPRGNTKLGRLLSHFTKTPFKHSYYGPFESMEGFWYFMRSGKKHDNLRYLYGNVAKQAGRELPPQWYAEFWEDIMAGNYQKVIKIESLCEMVKDSTLPFTQYYFYENTGIVIYPRDHEKLCKCMEDIRTAVKQNKPTEAWIKANARYEAEIQAASKVKTDTPEP